MKNNVCKQCGGNAQIKGDYYVCTYCDTKWSIYEEKEGATSAKMDENDLKKQIKAYVGSGKTLDDVKEHFSDAADEATIEKLLKSLYVRAEIDKIEEDGAVYYVAGGYSDEKYEKYSDLVSRQKSAKTSYEYSQLLKGYMSLGDYKDCRNRAKVCCEEVERLFEEEHKAKASTPAASKSSTKTSQSSNQKKDEGDKLLIAGIVCIFICWPLAIYFFWQRSKLKNK